MNKFMLNLVLNKKVLLLERKRHTDRRVESICSAGLALGVTGTPSSPWGGGGTHPVLTSQVHPCLDLGPDQDGVPPPRKGLGISGSIMGWRYYRMDMGYPPFPRVDRHTAVKTVPSPSFGCGR